MEKSARKIIGRLKQNDYVGQPSDEHIQLIVAGLNALHNFDDGIPPGNEFFFGEGYQSLSVSQ